MRFPLLVTLSVIAIHSGMLMGQTPDERGYIVAVGDAMPDFELTTLDGITYNRENLLGTTYVLQFTASWCSVCRKEMPDLESQVHQAFKGRNFLLLGVDFDEDSETVARFADQMGITYAIAPDPAGQTFHQIAGHKSGVTRNVLVDSTGIIRFLTRLYDHDEFEQLVAAIDALTQP